MTILRVLAFDQSVTQTGWARWDVSPFRHSDESAIECGSFSAADGKNDVDKSRLFGREVKRLIGRFRPAFLSWERPKATISIYDKQDDADLLADAPRQSRWTVNPKQFLLHRIAGQIEQAALDYSIPFAEVGVKTWRADIFGIGGGNLDRVTAKTTAKITARRFGIRFSNENEAEAALIAVWTARCCQEFRLMAHKAREAA